MKSRTNAKDGEGTNVFFSGAMTRSRHKTHLLLSRRTDGPVTRARGYAPSIRIITQRAAETAAEKRRATKAQKAIDRALGNSLVIIIIIIIVYCQVST